MKLKKNLSVIIPAYNEEATLEEVIKTVLQQPMVAEVIVIDDNSTDKTPEIISSFGKQIRSTRNKTNKGKGYGVRKGISMAQSKYLLVQDADLEYDPADYAKLMKAMLQNNPDLINSVRDFSSQDVQLITRLGSRVIPDLVFLFFGKSIKDIVSCYKLMKTETWKKLNLKSDRFELETEIMVKAIINVNIVTKNHVCK